jgi:hypothetical protein
MMLRSNKYFERFQVGRLLIVAAFSIFLSGSFDLVWAQQPGQKTFSSSEKACAALLSAVRMQDQTALLELLGPKASEIVSVGDQSVDRDSQRQFIEKYNEMHRLVREPDGTTTLYVGAENWPLPIVIRNKGNKWYFDPIASRVEILFRRIGRNELETIAVCRELINAQLEYYAAAHDGEVKQFAPKFHSSDGKHNGLYWKISSSNEQESPIGPWLTLANTDDYAKETTRARPFRGYYYRVLNRQGRNARGGAMNYVVNGKMTGGFAFVAYPAEYRSSGVMTFIVNRDGTVYQKDLGAQTVVRARAMSQYNPDSTWKRVD